MRSPRRRKARPSRAPRGEQCGYTLVELLVVMTLAVIVVGVPMSFIVLSLTQQNVASSRSTAAVQEELGLARLTRDLREVVPSTTTTFTWGPSSASVTFTIPVAGTGAASTQTVTWSCDFAPTGSCTRQVGSGNTVRELIGVQGVTFSPVDASGHQLGGSTAPYTAQNPAYVAITVKVQDTSQSDPSASAGVSGVGNPLILQDGVDLRNNSL
ncbi:MAG: PulJ/GspJ family protein [Solirubrobacteraceae bacterium]